MLVENPLLSCIIDISGITGGCFKPIHLLQEGNGGKTRIKAFFFHFSETIQN
jgi:hypothetical protein